MSICFAGRHPFCVALLTLPLSLRAQRLAPSSAQLHTLANEKWETLLLFLVGQGEAPAAEHGSTCAPLPSPPSTCHTQLTPLPPRCTPSPPPRLDIGALLRGAGLVVTACEAAQASGVPLDADDDPAALAVSDAGFRYLLLERSQQLWLLLQHYVALSDALAGDPAAVLDVLLHLSFLPPHVPQPVPDPAQLTLLGDMATLGMVHIFGTQPDALWFCVTPLASAVSAGLAASGGARAMEGHIIVETNFRVYAYTSSLIELAILNFFVRHEYTLPNLFVGALTRESVIEAHRNGISAEQVVSYLQSHAHPHVAGRVPTVPETVSDQIRLWARDTQRLRASPATLYDDFPSDRAFGAAKAHAQGLGALLWADDTRRTMVANQEVQGAMREWFRVQREQGTHT